MKQAICLCLSIAFIESPDDFKRNYVKCRTNCKMKCRGDLNITKERLGVKTLKSAFSFFDLHFNYRASPTQ